jgi:hypothetical protein
VAPYGFGTFVAAHLCEVLANRLLHVRHLFSQRRLECDLVRTGVFGQLGSHVQPSAVWLRKEAQNSHLCYAKQVVLTCATDVNI